VLSERHDEYPVANPDRIGNAPENVPHDLSVRSSRSYCTVRVGFA
jgi:hypothetical protein